VSKVITGKEHCLALTHEKKVLSWGNNQYGVLGYEAQNIATPTLIRKLNQNTIIESLANETTTDIFCGKWHNFSISITGVWAWGRYD
jgi:regulator of chromosome condensation